MSQPNWFFGFPIDGRFLSSLPPSPEGFRLFHPDDVHMTLAFLGSCGEESAMKALAALDEGLRGEPQAALPVSLGRVVPMGSERRYSALSALIDEGRDAAAACLALRRDALTEAAGARPETRAPKPHVTIARPGHGATARDRELGIEWAGRLHLGRVRATLDRIALYTRSEEQGGARFRIVAERKLG